MNWRMASFTFLPVAAAVAMWQQGAQARNVSEQSVAGPEIMVSSALSRAPKLVEVKMTNEGGTFRFDPREIRIVAGDTVKWVVGGGSHNIEFWPDSVPVEALPALRAALHDTVAPLRTARFPNPGDSYTMVWTAMPRGVYKYFCRPHLMRGMTGMITVE
jgi:plastocyanin